MDYTVHGILQARIQEWVAFLFSRQSSQLRDWTQVSRIAGRFFTSRAKGRPRILESVAYPFSRGSSQPRNWTRVSCIAGGFFTIWASRETQEYWSASLIPSPGDLPNPGTQPGSSALQVDSLLSEPPGKTTIYMLQYIGGKCLLLNILVTVKTWANFVYYRISKII